SGTACSAAETMALAAFICMARSSRSTPAVSSHDAATPDSFAMPIPNTDAATTAAKTIHAMPRRSVKRFSKRKPPCLNPRGSAGDLQQLRLQLALDAAQLRLGGGAF